MRYVILLRVTIFDAPELTDQQLQEMGDAMAQAVEDDETLLGRESTKYLGDDGEAEVHCPEAIWWGKIEDEPSI